MQVHTKCTDKKYWTFRGRASLEERRVFIARPFFIRLWHFSGATAQGKEGLEEAEGGDAEDHAESLCISRKQLAPQDLWLPFHMTQLINAGAKCNIMVFGRRLKPPSEINNFSHRPSEVTLRLWPPEKALHGDLALTCLSTTVV